MHGDGYETGQVSLFQVFVRIFGQSNPLIKLCATNLRARAKRKQKIVQGHGQFNIHCNNIVLAFESYKVS